MDKEKHGFGRLAVIYLIGLLISGLYVGLIAPLRLVIQADFGIDDARGIWMVSVYTLFYAALIPVSGNLADRYGRKVVYLFCLLVFGTGSLICGFSQQLGSYETLLVGRIVQAAGAGGIIPVATAEVGMAAPQGKRGMWLGIASSVAGVSNVVGAAAGSGIVGLVGVDQWGWAFFCSAPISLTLAFAALICLPKGTPQRRGRLDIAGSALFTIVLLSMLVGLRELDFFHINTIVSIDVWGPLLVAVVLAGAFREVERRASDPIFHIEYLADRHIVLVLAIAFFVGCSIISMVLVPQFAEALLDLPVGSGGYHMAVLGVAAFVGPPLSGKLIDTHGPKMPLAFGLAITTIGFVFLAVVAIAVPSLPIVLIGLAIVGFGMGFSMGTPLNYMMLQNTEPEQSTSAIATLALVRQVGTTIAPAILVGFVSASAGMAGYRNMLLVVALFNAAAFIMLLFYRSSRSKAPV